MDNLIRKMAVFLEIAERRQARKLRLGRTVFVKLLYLLQEGFGVRLGYDFELYTYGPFDSSVLADLDYASATSVLSVGYDAREVSYSIRPLDEEGSFERERKQVNAEFGTQIDKLFELYGEKKAAELELISTTHFVSKDHPDWDDAKILEAVGELKPAFKLHERESALAELRASGLLAA